MNIYKARVAEEPLCELRRGGADVEFSLLLVVKVHSELLDGFQLNLVGEWGLDQGRTHQILWWIEMGSVVRQCLRA